MDPAKGYSFDVKGQYCALIGIPALMRAMATETDRLVRKYDMGGRVETESDAPLYLARLQELRTPVASLVISLGDIDAPLATAAQFGAAGISFKYGAIGPFTTTVVDGIHGTGFRIAVWTIDAPADIAAVWATGADVIQTDNRHSTATSRPPSPARSRGVPGRAGRLSLGRCGSRGSYACARSRRWRDGMGG